MVLYDIYFLSHPKTNAIQESQIKSKWKEKCKENLKYTKKNPALHCNYALKLAKNEFKIQKIFTWWKMQKFERPQHFKNTKYGHKIFDRNIAKETNKLWFSKYIKE